MSVIVPIVAMLVELIEQAGREAHLEFFLGCRTHINDLYIVGQDFACQRVIEVNTDIVVGNFNDGAFIDFIF